MNTVNHFITSRNGGVELIKIREFNVFAPKGMNVLKREHVFIV